MAIVRTLVQLLLTCVFVVAGAAKIADRPGFRRTLIEFGLPAVLASPFSIILPCIEIAVAVALLFPVWAWWGALGAVILLLLFIAGMSFNLLHGRTPDCRCFGQLAATPIGWPALIRNVLLVAAAAFILWSGRTDLNSSSWSWLFSPTFAQQIGPDVSMIILAALAVETWFILFLLRQRARSLPHTGTLEAEKQPDEAAAASTKIGLPVGTVAPDFRLMGLHTEIQTLAALRTQGKPVLLIFANPDCTACNALLPDIAHWQRGYQMLMTVVLVSQGTAEANEQKNAQYRLAHVLLQQEREVAQSYQTTGTPSAVLIHLDGTITSPTVVGGPAISLLVMQTVRGALAVLLRQHIRSLLRIEVLEAEKRPGEVAVPASTKIGGLPVGTVAPDFQLMGLHTEIQTLAALRAQGKPVLLIFVDSDCTACNALMPDIAHWQRGYLTLMTVVLISQGTAEMNEQKSTKYRLAHVLLQQEREVAQSYQAIGTPSAVLIHLDGTIASPTVVGGPAISLLVMQTVRGALGGSQPSTAKEGQQKGQTQAVQA